MTKATLRPRVINVFKKYHYIFKCKLVLAWNFWDKYILLHERLSWWYLLLLVCLHFKTFCKYFTMIPKRLQIVNKSISGEESISPWKWKKSSKNECILWTMSSHSWSKIKKGVFSFFFCEEKKKKSLKNPVSWPLSCHSWSKI